MGWDKSDTVVVTVGCTAFMLFIFVSSVRCCYPFFPLPFSAVENWTRILDSLVDSVETGYGFSAK